MLVHQGRILLLTSLGTPKWSWPLINPHRTFFIQTSTLPPSIHWKLGKCCMQKKKLPTKSHVELEDDSIMSLMSCFSMCFHHVLVVPLKVLHSFNLGQQRKKAGQQSCRSMRWDLLLLDACRNSKTKTEIGKAVVLEQCRYFLHRYSVLCVIDVVCICKWALFHVFVNLDSEGGLTSNYKMNTLDSAVYSINLVLTTLWFANLVGEQRL